MTGEIIIITGTPGTGKTTLGSMLASVLMASHIDVPELVEAEGLYKGVDEERGSKIVDLSRVRRRLRRLAKRVAKLVVSSHVPDVAYRSDVGLVVVLRLNPCELKKRLEGLGWPPRKVRENLAAEAVATCLKEAVAYYGDEVVRELNVTHLSVEEAVARLVEVIRGVSEGDRVDWLVEALRDEELARLLASL